MSHCCDILSLSALACTIADTLDDENLNQLAIDLTLLGDLFANIAVRRANENCEQTDRDSLPASFT